MEIRSELEEQLLNLSKEMKDIAVSYTGQLQNDNGV